MGRYILNRLIYLIPVLFFMSLVVFMFIHLIPGDPVDAILGYEYTPEAGAVLRAELGLDSNIFIQYISWAGNLLAGDFGKSVITHQPVLDIIFDKLGATMLLAFAAILISLVIAILAGTIAATHKGSWKDFMLLIMSLIGVSIPSFWLGILLMLLFAVHWQVFPSIGYVSMFEDFGGAIRHLTLPAVTLGAIFAGAVARMTRSEMIEQLSQDYIITARAKGLSPWEVNYKHALRNSLITVVTFTGLQLGTLLGGAVVVETIFSWPGIGQILITSIFTRDYPLVQGIILFMSLIFVLVNLLVDISYTFLNPQIRLGRRD